VEEFLQQLTEEGFGEPTRSMYFIWVDRYIVVTRDLTKKYIEKLVRGMVDGIFVHKTEVYDFAEEQYLLVARFNMNLYDVVFFLPSRDGYLAGKKYFMRIKGKIDIVSLRQLYKLFRTKLSARK
jgi:hypothetical protein